MGLKQPHKIRVSFDDIGHGETAAEEFFYNNEHFNGYLVFDYHPNGTIMYEEEIRNGVVMGWVNEYYENGNMKREEICMYSIQNTIMFRTFDEDGKETDIGLLVSPETYEHYLSEHHFLD
ncbi:hypothetical protein C1637_13850 [Chryseobacterium lactis]|uniref:YopX protein domain-containing protein n=1 Tax=Chryseobacterium lactis TaxID=1241981 RepID=A0A3G6RIX7_CHRLC|nr:hypothetical protein [Chryseobacterium lactis]AZA83793.1 hypothetical protein EG342_18715 [Chryseobacterium lactis]AZB04178.1 hypothetical protein EG341_09590 [Chryseobacterium lactis]PNW12913.1 hypothetical protein C1637_13850 [Chryseobacterium lactis]